MKVAWVLVVAMLLAGCGGGGAGGPASPSASASPAASPVATATVTENELASASPTAAPSVSATPSAAPAPSASAEARVVLNGDGLAIAAFGDGPEDVIAALDGRYGSPTEDSGWVDHFQFGVCPGTINRRVRYGQLSALMSDGPSDYAAGGQNHFFQYSVSAQTDDPGSEYGDGPQTADGIGIGSTVADLRAAFGDGLEVREDEVYGPNFVVTSEGTVQQFVYMGSLTDTTDAGLVTVFSAGQGCGE